MILKSRLQTERILPSAQGITKVLWTLTALFPARDYSELNESHVIFLCMEDAFGNGSPVYDFHQVCKQDSEVLLNDETHKVFFNASKYDKMPTESLREFLNSLTD